MSESYSIQRTSLPEYEAFRYTGKMSKKQLPGSVQLSTSKDKTKKLWSEVMSWLPQIA
jgi:hypothetical protein